MTDLQLNNISVQGRVTNASLHLNRGEFVAILGPNGAGKSTLLKTAMGLMKPDAGEVIYGAEKGASLSPIERAKRISYLPQIRPMAWPNIVRDVVALGRYSHGASLGHLKGADKTAVDDAIAACDLGHLSQRSVDNLSGGELARVHCARAFAAKAPLLIADEPVAALDPRHQFRIMDLIASYVKNGGGALVVLHDVGLAAKYADRLIWMKDSEIIADGSPEDTLSAKHLAQIYGVRAHVDGKTVRIEGAIED